jgi:peptidyl-prolyl cis-trans isomerase D
MMETMRKAAQGWVAKVLLVILAISFGIFFNISDAFRNFGSSTLARVGDREISPAAFERNFRDYLQNLGQQTGQAITIEDARKMGLDRAVLDNMIREAAVDNETDKLGLNIGQDYLVKEAMGATAFKNAAGKFDPELFKRILQQNGLTEAGYFAETRQRLLRSALTGAATADVTPGATLREAQYRHANEQRDARYFVVKAAESEVTPPTDDEIKKEYESNPGAYTAPEYRSIAVMKVEPADIAAKIQLADADLQAGYDKFKSEYFTPERRTVLQLSFPTLEEAKAAKDKIAAGTDFLALATEKGFKEADITFADKTRADFFDKAIADAAFALPEGGVSEPVKGALATVLLKAVKIQPEHQSSLNEVKPQLTERLRLEQARDEIQSIYEAVEDARAAQTKFEDIAAKAGIPFLLVPATDASGKGHDGKDIDMPHKDDLLRASFASDVGVENDAISVDDGYVWYEVREVVPSAVKPFEQVKEQAKARVVAGKVRALAEDKAKKLVERAKGGATLDDLAKEAGAEVQTAQGLRRNENTDGFGAAAVNALFAVPEKSFAHAVESDGNAARVMQSEAVMLPAFDPKAPENAKAAEALGQAMGNDLAGAYLAALKKDAGVTVNETLWRQISGQTDGQP